MRIRLLCASIAILLSGCGGGSEDAGTTTPPTQPPVQPPAPVQYIASSVSANGGALDPSSQKVESGKSAIFSITADTGFTLEAITGCGGTLNALTYTTAAITADCTITPTFITNAENAIEHQDHKLASASELIDFSIAKLASIDIKRKAQINQLYQGVGSSISWHPTHDSITFSSFMPENTFTVLPSNVDGSGASAVRGLVMAGEQQGQRYAAMGGNLFSVNTSAQTDTLLKNLLGWLTKGADKTDGLSIVTTQMPSKADSWYFPHNEDIRTWLANNYPAAHSINAANTCDYSELSNCIDTLKPDVIVISDIDRQSLGFAGIKAAIAKAKTAGIPLLLSNYWRNQSPMLSPLYLEMGLSTSGNYWSKLNASDLSVTDVLAEDTALTKVNNLLGKLNEASFDTSVLNDCTGNYLNCNAAAFVDSFKAGADWYRANAETLDNNAIDVFTKADFPLMKAGLLLADKYRSEIDYPIAYSEHAQWQQALFADWTVSYARTHNLAQPDLGEYVTDRANLSKGSNAHYAYPATVSERKTISVPYAGQWTTTGWYALPGQTIKLTRLDSNAANVEIKLNYHRRNTNRAYEQKIYRGPLELAQQRLRLAQGKSIEFSSPTAGRFIYTSMVMLRVLMAR
ncbi:hypothetical protein LFREDSHE_43330 [Shewanella baltica]